MNKLLCWYESRSVPSEVSTRAINACSTNFYAKLIVRSLVLALKTSKFLNVAVRLFALKCLVAISLISTV